MSGQKADVPKLPTVQEIANEIADYQARGEGYMAESILREWAEQIVYESLRVVRYGESLEERVERVRRDLGLDR